MEESIKLHSFVYDYYCKVRIKRWVAGIGGGGGVFDWELIINLTGDSLEMLPLLGYLLLLFKTISLQC